MKTDELEESGTNYARLALLVGALLLIVRQFGVTLNVVIIIVAIVVMIFLHELGHYLTAKWAGMKVTQFFLGFGPKIWSFRKGETEYGLKAIPAGAYVRIIGMSNLEEVDPADEERTYRAKPYWRRLSVVIAGSTMHFILAFVLACVFFMGFGQKESTAWHIADVSGPAQAAGLQAGDRILSLEGRTYDDYFDVQKAIQARPGERITLEIDRRGERRSLDVQLAAKRPEETERVGFLGIRPEFETVRYGPGKAVGAMGTMAKDSVAGLGRLFSPNGVEKYVDNLTGDAEPTPGLSTNADRPLSVVGIGQVGSQVAESGMDNVIYMLFGVNMFIGIFNLLPVLPFDGGHVAIATYEKIRSMISGRRYQADVSKLMPLAYAVVLVLMLLFLTTIYMDLLDPIDLG